MGRLSRVTVCVFVDNETLVQLAGAVIAFPLVLADATESQK